MKKSILSISFFLLFAGISFANSPVFSDPHDSLLFDGGDDGNSTIFLRQFDDIYKCKMKVVNVVGEAWGYVLVDTTVELMGCGEGPYKGVIFVEHYRKIKKGDLLAPGRDEEITTSIGSFLAFTLSDGTGIALGPVSKMTLDSDCEEHYNIGSYEGDICVYQTGKKQVHITTDRVSIEHLETKFSVKVVNNIDTSVVTKVYEGSVKVSLTNPDMSGLEAKIEQLKNDYQDGKISIEEFQSKIMEYQEQANTQLAEIQPVTVEPGYKCIATKNSLKLEPIESNDDRWWEKLDMGK